MLFPFVLTQLPLLLHACPLGHLSFTPLARLPQVPGAPPALHDLQVAVQALAQQTRSSAAQKVEAHSFPAAQSVPLDFLLKHLD